MSARYARVQQEDVPGTAAAKNIISASRDTNNAARLERRRQRAEKAEYYSTKLHALLWILGAAGASYFTDFFNVCASSPKVNRFWFNTALLCLVVAFVLIMYMAVWVPRVLKITYEPQVYSPRMLPVTGTLCLSSMLFFVFGLWPVYGFFTPGLLFLLFLSILMSAHFLPGI